MTQPIVIDEGKAMIAAAKLLTENPMFKIGQAVIRGNEYRVFENAPANLVALFAYGAATHGEKPFILYEDEVWSYARVWSAARRFADGLARQYGVKPGDRIALAMRNYPEWCVAYMGVISLGAVVVPLNAWWKTDELKFGLEDCGARLVIVDGKRLELLAALKQPLGLTLIGARDGARGADRGFGDVVAAGGEEPPIPAIGPEDDFCIVYTSGSTGRPKGVILTHRGAVTTLFSWAFLASVLRDARDGVSMFGDNPGTMLAVPLFHVTGSHSIFMMSWLIGRRMAMLHKWDAAEAAHVIRRHELTNFVGVPSQSYELLEAAGPAGLPSLLDIGSGGAKRPPEHVRLLKERFPNANPASGYGLSETNALGCVISLADYQKRPESTGRPVPPVCDLKIMTEEGQAKPGEVGEVWLRTAANFRGYLNLPDDTAKALTADGWFRTGDLGKLDDEGYLYIVDRIKDLIIRGGENISCLEVEARAYEHPAVAEALVFSVPDEVLGERVGLVYRARPGEELPPQALRDFMAAGLAGFKVPERIWISPQPLPRLGTEKFDKVTVRRIALQHPPAWKG